MCPHSRPDLVAPNPSAVPAATGRFFDSWPQSLLPLLMRSSSAIRNLRHVRAQ
ncbi:hypothetical protein H4S06_005096 [Coemansia sp. BCRC 34490]|nr:hypothetical protein H4S06_005096 [Coemansia sp. BCRC 34490]